MDLDSGMIDITVELIHDINEIDDRDVLESLLANMVTLDSPDGPTPLETVRKPDVTLSRETAAR